MLQAVLVTVISLALPGQGQLPPEPPPDKAQKVVPLRITGLENAVLTIERGTFKSEVVKTADGPRIGDSSFSRVSGRVYIRGKIPQVEGEDTHLPIEEADGGQPNV